MSCQPSQNRRRALRPGRFTYRGAAVISGTTHKTVKRVIARHEADGAVPARVPRGHNYDGVAELVAARCWRPRCVRMVRRGCVLMIRLGWVSIG
jgi:hypothetical protein